MTQMFPQGLTAETWEEFQFRRTSAAFPVLSIHPPWEHSPWGLHLHHALLQRCLLHSNQSLLPLQPCQLGVGCSGEQWGGLPGWGGTVAVTGTTP